MASTDLGTIGAFGVQGGQDALRQLLADKLKQALEAQQEEDRRRELELKAQEISGNADERKLAREGVQRQREAANWAGALDDTAPGQDVTGLAEQGKASGNPDIMARIPSLRKETVGNIWAPGPSQPVTTAKGDVQTGAIDKGPVGVSTKYYNPKQPPREPNPQEPIRVPNRALTGQFNPAHKGVPGVQVWTPDMKTLIGEIPDAPQQANPQTAANSLQNSYQYHRTKIDALAKPLTDRAERLTRLNDSINEGTQVADSVIAPELITVVAGGLGSGVRITNSEIESVVGGKDHWQRLWSALQSWNTDPNHAFKFTPEQRAQMLALVKHISDRSEEAISAIDEAGTALATAKSADEHKTIYNELRKKLSSVAQGKDISGAPAMPPKEQRVAGTTTHTWTSGPNAGKTGTWDGTAWVIK